MPNFELNIDIESIILKENIDNSFKEVFDIQTFSVDFNNTQNKNFDDIFKEEFVLKNDMSFNVELDNKSSVYNTDFRRHFDLHSFNVFCESNSNIDLNSSFKDVFNTNKSRVFHDLKSRVDEVDIVEDIPQVVEVEEEVEEKFPFTIELNEDGTVFDYDFRKCFNIINFETCVNRDVDISDNLFEEYFEIRCESTYDYDIINNLKKDFSSRKVLTRDDIPDQEVDIHSLDEDMKNSTSLEKDFEKKSSIIKEKIFYKIVEVEEETVEIEEKVLPEPKIETPNLDEFERKVDGLEEKYEDLLQKTKDHYEDQINKMTEEFAKFRTNIASQVSRMAMVSTSAGGGAVNILDMDDFDRSNLQDGNVLSYNSSLKKFQLIDNSASTLDLMHSFCFEITQTHLDNGYFDLPHPADLNYIHLSEILINGIQNNCPDQYTFTTTTRIDTSNLTLDLGDKVRIVYIKS